MKKLSALALVALLVFAPSLASAHEHQRFEIGGQMYEFTVGSLNEPLVVDDKSGVDLRIVMVGHEEMAANDHHAEGGAVTGLEETLQVELIAGEQKKILDLSPVYNTPGAYKAPFYPTVATTLTYRVFGTINDTPVDLSFSCNPAGHAVAPDDETEVEISEGVTRHFKSGSYGCPVEKAELGFPEASASVTDLSAEADGAKGMGTGALMLSVVALVLSVYGLRRK